MPPAARTYEFPSGLLELVVPAGAPIVRVHQIVHGAIWFGPEPGKPSVCRFDAPAAEFHTLYGAAELTGAFVETVLRRARRIIARPFVEQRQWTILAPRRDVLLAKAFDEGLIHHGVTADICAGDDYSASQRFAVDLHATFGQVDGIAYRARHNNGQICYALFDRVDSAMLETVESHEFKDERATVDDIMRRHGAVWDPATPLTPL
jgi:RES domain-containing protein